MNRLTGTFSAVTGAISGGLLTSSVNLLTKADLVQADIDGANGLILAGASSLWCHILIALIDDESDYESHLKIFYTGALAAALAVGGAAVYSRTDGFDFSAYEEPQAIVETLEFIPS